MPLCPLCAYEIWGKNNMNDLPDCMYDYRYDRTEEEVKTEMDYFECDLCCEEITEHEYDTNGGLCDDCLKKGEENN